MKTNILKYTGISMVLFAMLFASPLKVSAQDNENEPKEEVKKKEKPVRSPWNATTLIETQTDLVFAPKTLVWEMQHRFGNFNNSSGFDLAGIYGASNIRMGVIYGLFENFQIGLGTEKNLLLQDLNWKYKILTQTRSNSMPISMAYFGNVTFSAKPEADFGADYKFSKRMSYFNQLIISRKFTKNFTVMIAGNHAHFNQIDTSAYPSLKHDNFSLTFAGRLKVTPTVSIVAEYEQPLTTPGALLYVKSENPDVIKNEVGLRNFSLGLEIATSSHAFHVFVTTYRGLNYQQNLTYNTNFITNGDLLLGFNITRNWNF